MNEGESWHIGGVFEVVERRGASARADEKPPPADLLLSREG